MEHALMKKHDYRLGYRADLEGLRALAILLVVAVHAGVPWLRGGFVGVDAFFVLSGFLITGLLVQEVSDSGRVDFARFYVRRLRRLLPALFIMLAVVVGLASLLLAPMEQHEQSNAAAMAAVWLSNIHFAFAQQGYFAPGSETNLFLHTWSLGVEEQFYLVWPALLVWLLGRDGERGVRRLKIGMAVVLVTSFVASLLLTYKASQLAFYMMPMRAWEFAAGALIWLYFRNAKSEPTRAMVRLLPVIGWLGLALTLLAGVLLSGSVPYPGAYALLPTVGTACIIAAGCMAPSLGVSRLLSWRPLQWIGRVSYSWYLWHWPVLLLGHSLVGSDAPIYRLGWVLLSLLLASISYRYIESPIRNWQGWLVRPGRAIFGALALMLVGNSLCLRWNVHADKEMHSPAVARYIMAHGDAPIIYRMGCDDWYHSDRVKVCAFGSADARHTAVLIGDSHAGQWFPAAQEVFDRPGWRLVVLTKSACPMVDEPFFYPRIGREYKVCASWRRQALREVAALKPDVVLMTSASYRFSREQWVDGTADVLRSLSPAAGHVYILRDTPSLPFDGPGCLAEHLGRPAWLGLRDTCSAPAANVFASKVYRWIASAAKRFPNVTVLDMDGSICPDGRCRAEMKGMVVFRDSQHMTASFAASLGSALAAKLDKEVPTVAHAVDAKQRESGRPASLR